VNLARQDKLSAKSDAYQKKLESTKLRMTSAEKEANVLAATYTDLQNHKKDARERHNKFLKQFSEKDLKKTFETGRVSVVKPAIKPDSRLWPSLTQVFLAAILLGLAAGVLGAFFWKGLDDSVKSGEDMNITSTMRMNKMMIAAIFLKNNRLEKITD